MQLSDIRAGLVVFCCRMNPIGYSPQVERRGSRSKSPRRRREDGRHSKSSRRRRTPTRSRSRSISPVLRRRQLSKSRSKSRERRRNYSRQREQFNPAVDHPDNSGSKRCRFVRLIDRVDCYRVFKPSSGLSFKNSILPTEERFSQAIIFSAQHVLSSFY